MPGWIANYPPQKPAVDALEACGLAAPCQVIANACASGTNALGHAFECIRAGRYERVLAGGYDALSELVFVGFDSLQASTAEKCRPFDGARSGLVLGEGAALLALENFASAEARGAQILAEITGYGISTDNHHLTQPHPSGIGPRQAMERALQSAGRQPDEINYVNAHGTATPFNDSAEGRAIAELLGRVPVSSTKGMMGHSLGAAGAIEAVITLLALGDGFLPANINFRAPEAGLDLDIVANEPRPAPEARVALSNSFGFGGTNATIVLEALRGMMLLDLHFRRRNLDARRRLSSGERTRLACPFRRLAEMLCAPSVLPAEAIGESPIAARESRALPGSRSWRAVVN